jgi:hypothetical protein
MEDLLKKANMIKKRYEGIWMALDNITGVGTGLTASGIPGIIISMEKEDARTRDLFPPRIEGVPVELKLSGKINTC